MVRFPRMVYRRSSGVICGASSLGLRYRVVDGLIPMEYQMFQVTNKVWVLRPHRRGSNLQRVITSSCIYKLANIHIENCIQM